MKKQETQVFKRHPAKGPDGRREIKTARTEDAINIAAREGFWPLIKLVKPHRAIRSKVAVFQNQENGEIQVSGDYRWYGDGVMVIEFVRYYPHQFPNPYAAYLLPPDLTVGEEVWLEDLIEDVVESYWNQGEAFRLEACAALWDGKDFKILFDARQHTARMVG